MSELWREQVRRDRDPELIEINRLALARIQQIEQEIYDHCGIRLHMGIEQEFYLEDKKGDKQQGLIDSDSIQHRVRWQLEAHPSLKGSYIERFYDEINKEALEVVQGFVPAAHASLQDIHYHKSPSRQATHMDHLRQWLVIPANWRNPKVHQVSMAIKPGDLRVDTSAMQISISAYNEAGENLFAARKEGRCVKSDLMKICAESLLEVQKRTLKLDALYPTSYEQLKPLFPGGEGRRFKMGRKQVQETGHSIRLRDYEDKESYYKKEHPNTDPSHFFYLENCLPRGDGNVYLAVLQTVAGIHNALMHHVKIVDSKEKAPFGYEITAVDDRHMLAHHYVAGNVMPQNLHSEAQSENIFARDGFAKELLGEELHAKVAAYFSREAIAKREAQLESAQHGMR
jgi:hypothetical protein